MAKTETGKRPQDAERISGQVNINEDQQYGVLILERKGCLNIGGMPDPGVEELRVKIGALKVDKENGGAQEYDIMFTSPRNGKLRIILEIEDLQTGLRTLSYAADGLGGRDGSPGGNGGFSAFGMGGAGGDGSDGEDGMDGTDCPDVRIIYGSSNGSGIAHVTMPSAGGAGGKGGPGGSGGLCGDGMTYAPSGKAGRDGRNGRPGGKGEIRMIKASAGEKTGGALPEAWMQTGSDGLFVSGKGRKEHGGKDGY